MATSVTIHLYFPLLLIPILFPFLSPFFHFSFFLFPSFACFPDPSLFICRLSFHHKSRGPSHDFQTVTDWWDSGGEWEKKCWIATHDLLSKKHSTHLSSGALLSSPELPFLCLKILLWSEPNLLSFFLASSLMVWRVTADWPSLFLFLFSPSFFLLKWIGYWNVPLCGHE